MSASSPSSSFSTSDSTVASPHSTRCSPQIHRSPGRLIGSTGTSGAWSRSSPPSVSFGEQPIEIGVVEAEQREVDVLVLQSSKLGCQHRLVPAGVLGDAVVGDHQGPALGRRQMREHDHRHVRQSELPGSQHPAVARDDHAVVADQHRIDEAELGDRPRDLRDLIFGVSSGIPRMRDQPVERPALDRFGILHRHESFDFKRVAPTGGNQRSGYQRRLPAECRAEGRQRRGIWGGGAIGRATDVVTGNSDFAAIGSELPRRCPPHTNKRQGRTRALAAALRCTRISRSCR